MFKLFTGLFFSPADNSKKSYAYRKNPSAIDWAITTLISTIFKNIPFLNKTTNKKEEIQESVNEQIKNNSTKISSGEESKVTKEESEITGGPHPEDRPLSAPLVGTGIEPLENKTFPQDYVSEIRKLHDAPLSSDYNPQSTTIPEIYSIFHKYRLDEEIVEFFEQPITNLSQLEARRKQWLYFEEKLQGKNFDDIYYITSTEEENSNAELIPAYDEKAYKKYITQKKKCNSPFDRCKLELQQILATPKGLQNFILMFGLEYSVIIDTSQKPYGGEEIYTTSYEPCISKLNSAKKFLSGNLNNEYVIKIPLINLAVEQGILPEVEFLLTEKSVNCEGYQRVNLSNYIKSPNTKNGQQSQSVPYTLMILDNPLKVAIDNYDVEAMKILLAHGADPNVSIRARLTELRPKDTIHSLEPRIKLSDYFITIEPDPKNTQSYIDIANLLYLNLTLQDQTSFIKNAENKKLTIHNASTNTTQDQILSDLLLLEVATKSARTVVDQKQEKEGHKEPQEEVNQNPPRAKTEEIYPNLLIKSNQNHNIPQISFDNYAYPDDGSQKLLGNTPDTYQEYDESQSKE